jgi:hypothetical protein
MAVFQNRPNSGPNVLPILLELKPAICHNSPLWLARQDYNGLPTWGLWFWNETAFSLPSSDLLEAIAGRLRPQTPIVARLSGSVNSIEEKPKRAEPIGQKLNWLPQ